MSAYLDSSVVVSMFGADVHTRRVVTWLAGRAASQLALSEWTLTEFSSAVAIATRVGSLTVQQRQRAENAIDTWLVGQPAPIALAAGDGETARGFIRHGVRPLRSGDALHLAIVARTGYSLATMDHRMAAAAADLGIPVEAI